MVTDSLYAPYRDPKYAAFSRKLSPTDILPRAGVRIPILRELAKKIPYNAIDITYHEDVILKGLALSNEKAPFSQKIDRLNMLLPYLSSWDQTDILATGFKSDIEDNEKLNYFVAILSSNLLFARRLAIVWLLQNRKLLGKELVLELILKADEPNHYYIMMAVSWALSELYLDDHSILPRFNEVSKLTSTKAKQKIRESRRYTGESLDL